MRDTSNESGRAENRVSRRYILGGLTGITVGLSGCLGWLPFGSDSDSSTAISETAFSQTDLTITLAEGSDATSVGLIDSEGSSVVTREISSGQTKASLPLITDNDQPLTEGTYRVVVGQDEKTIDEQSIELAASWELTKVRSHDPPMSNGVPTDIALTVENTGRLPLKLANLSVEGVSNPVDEASPPRINAEAAEIAQQQLIGIDQSAEFHTETRPFEHERSAKSSCETTKQATLSLDIKPTGTRQFNASVSYDGGQVESSQLTKFCKNISIENVSKQS